MEGQAAMYSLMTDETNVTVGPNRKFFIYGGLEVDTAVLPDLTEKIEAI